ncbi:MAG: hypothetical protein WCJ86_00185 [Candidatus Saccharibacteria bacterium]
MTLPETQKPKSENLELVLASPVKETLANPNVSDLERSMFTDGVYIFDPSTEHSVAEDDIASRAEWYKNNPHWDEDRTRGSLSRDIVSKRWELAWKQHFSGQVPKDWEMWYEPVQDIEEAGSRGVQLSGTLIDAAVSHDHHLVANKAGTLQGLNTHQLAVAFARGLPAWNIGDIVEAQRQRGMSEEQIAEAKEMAVDIRRRMSDGTVQLGSGTPEISQAIPPKRTVKSLLKGVVSRG